MEFNKIKIATILADAMVDKLKEEKLIEEFAENWSDDLESFGKSLMTIFGMKIIPEMITFVEDECSEDFDEEDKEMLETFKRLFNIKENKND